MKNPCAEPDPGKLCSKVLVVWLTPSLLLSAAFTQVEPSLLQDSELTAERRLQQLSARGFFGRALEVENHKALDQCHEEIVENNWWILLFQASLLCRES